MRKFLILALFCAACGNQSTDTDAIVENASEVASVQTPECTTELASKPPVAKTFGEMQSAAAGIICEGAKPRSSDSSLSMNGIPLDIGTAIDEVEGAARRAGAKVEYTFAGRAFVFKREIPRPTGSFSSSPREETRRYWFNSDGGKLVGFRLCENYESGYYENGPNSEYVAALGPPLKIEILSNGVYATDLRMNWRNGTMLEVSGSPNTARLDVGAIPVAFRRANSKTNVRLYRDLVQREDRMDRDLARRLIAQENCLTSDELQNIIVPLLEAGVSSDY